jgi:hypothetical protein
MLRFTGISAAILTGSVIFYPACSQDYPAKNIYRIFIEMNAQHSPQRAFEDVSGLYGFSSASALLSVPLISKVTEGKDLTKKLLGVTAKGKGEITLPDISFIKSDHLLINLSGSVNALYNGNKNTWQGTFTTSLSEDNYTIALPKYVLRGVFCLHAGPA